MHQLSLLLLVAALVLSSPPAGRGQQTRTLTAPEVKEMVARDNALLIHVLSRIEFDMQHIPGSINIPITELATSNALPADTDRPLIFYCMGER
jgi:rhodanese-related sulfurtransferase